MIAENKSLISKLIRLAYGEPHLRPFLMPIIVEGLNTISYQVKVAARKKTRSEKKKKHRGKVVREALSDFMFTTWLTQVKRHESWVDPETGEENNPSTLISKARGGASEKSEEWAQKIIIEEYERYQEAEPEMVSAFENLNTSLTYGDFKAGAEELLEVIRSQGDSYQALSSSFCNALRNSCNAGSYFSRTNFFTRALDNMLWDTEKKWSDVAKGVASVASIVSAVSGSSDAYMMIAEKMRLKDWENIKKELESAETEEEKKEILMRSVKENNTRDMLDGVKSMALNLLTGSLFVGLGLDDKAFQLPHEEISEFVGNMMTKQGFQAEIAKSVLDTKVRRIVDKLGEKAESAIQVDSSAIKAMIESLATTADSPAAINQEYYNKLFSARTKMLKASTKKERESSLSEAVGAFQEYLTYGVQEAKKLEDDSALRGFTKHLKNLSGLLSPTDYLQRDRVDDGLGSSLSYVDDTLDAVSAPVEYLPNIAEKTVDAVVSKVLRTASDKPSYSEQSMIILLDMMALNKRKIVGEMLQDNAEELGEISAKSLISLSTEEGLKSAYAKTLMRAKELAEKEGMTLEELSDQIKKARKKQKSAV